MFAVIAQAVIDKNGLLSHSDYECQGMGVGTESALLPQALAALQSSGLVNLHPPAKKRPDLTPEEKARRLMEITYDPPEQYEAHYELTDYGKDLWFTLSDSLSVEWNLKT